MEALVGNGWPRPLRGVYILHQAQGNADFALEPGGAGAHAYPIERAADDPFQSKEVNYHYLLAEVYRGSLKITMHRLDLTSGTAIWTQPDSITISAPAAKAPATGQ